MARVAESHPIGPTRYALATEFLAMAQVDRDSLADFLQAVGPTSLTVRALRDQ
jgi:hypothetical protein